MLMTPVVFSPGARSRVPILGLRYWNARDLSRFEGREGLGSDLVILETHERDGLLGRKRGANIRRRHPERSFGLIGDRIPNI